MQDFIDGIMKYDIAVENMQQVDSNAIYFDRDELSKLIINYEDLMFLLRLGYDIDSNENIFNSLAVITGNNFLEDNNYNISAFLHKYVKNLFNQTTITTYINQKINGSINIHPIWKMIVLVPLIKTDTKPLFSAVKKLDAK